MNWINLQASIIRAPEYVGSEPVQRATWFNILVYSSEQENGGRIIGARQWKCRRWQQTCGVMLSEVESAAPLLTWDGNDLIVWGYPHEREQEARRMRELGEKRTEKKAAAARMNGKHGGRPPETQRKPNEENPTEPIQDKIREDKVIEDKTNTGPIPASECAADAVFDRFWKLYPRQEKRARALCAYQRNNCLAISDAVMEGLKRWLASDQWERGIFPEAERWLDNHQWEDHPKPAKRQTEPNI